MSKPYHLMTPAERTAARIAKNRIIDQRVAAAEALIRARNEAKGEVEMTRVYSQAAQLVADIETLCGRTQEGQDLLSKLRRAFTERSSLLGRNIL